MSRLAGLPALQVEVGGEPLAAPLAASLTGARIQERLSLPSLCELAFADPAAGDLGALAPGSPLAIRLPGGEASLFEGQVTALERIYGPSRAREVRVRGYDRLHQLRKRQPVRSLSQVDLPGLARQLTADLGISVESSEPGPVWDTIIEHCQTDLELLDELAGRCGLYYALRGSILHFLTLEGMGTAVPLELGADLLEARIEVNGDPACRTVTALGWDPGRARVHRATAGSARTGRVPAAAVDPSRVGGTGERILAGEVARDDREAELLAQAELDRRVGREVVLRGVAEGDGRLRPGTPVEVSGIDGDLDGRHVLAEVIHTLDPRDGHLTRISTAPPPPAPRQRGAGVLLGIVTGVNDPRGMGRVRISLPALAGAETGWLEVVLPAAGEGKGLAALPDVGDRVAVLLDGGDPAAGLVLGGLHGEGKCSGLGVEGGRIRQYALRTPGGQQVQLDDRAGRIRIQDAAGSCVDLSPEAVLVRAATDLRIEAPGKSVTIAGKAIEFREM